MISIFVCSFNTSTSFISISKIKIITIHSMQLYINHNNQYNMFHLNKTYKPLYYPHITCMSLHFNKNQVNIHQALNKLMNLYSKHRGLCIYCIKNTQCSFHNLFSNYCRQMKRMMMKNYGWHISPMSNSQYTFEKNKL